MSTVELLRQRQQDELEVIKAIYVNEVKEIKEEKSHTILSIHLGPQSGSSADAEPQQNQQYTHLLLCLTIPAKYPNTGPKISLERIKGLSTQEVTELRQGLENVILSNMGEEMILNLAQFTQDFLYEHQKRPTGSFYDEMLIRNQLNQEKNKKKEQEFQEQEVLGIKYEIERKKELLKEEARSRKEALKMYSEAMQESSAHVVLGSSPKDFSKDVMEGKFQRSKRSSSLKRSCGDDEPRITGTTGHFTTIEFNMGKSTQTFQRGEILGGNAFGYKVYAAIDTNEGFLIVISEWNLSFCGSRPRQQGLANSESQNYEDVLRQLNSMESEMKLLLKLQHPNIVEHIGMTIVKSPLMINTYVLKEFVHGITLQTYLQGTLVMDIPLLRHCALGILKALAFLHSNNVVHRFLRDTSVYLNKNGEVKVGDYGVERKLVELLRSVNGSTLSSDEFPPSIGRGAKKCDIYRLGILVISLLNGHKVTQNPPEFSGSLPPEILDFIKKCVDTNENARWTAHQLLEHPFLKLPLAKTKNFLNLKEAQEENNEMEEIDKRHDEILKFLGHAVKGHSRLRDEFEVEVWLGKGGFGDVLKVRNKLDGGIYALKRIRLNPRNKQLNKKITREVKLLSRLNHENVVRYYNSWIETVMDNTEETESPTSPSNAITTATSSKVRFKEDYRNVQNSLGIPDNVEDLAPEIVSQGSEWSSDAPNDSNDESDDSSDEEDLFGTSFLCLEKPSEDVVFGSTRNPATASESDARSSSEISGFERKAHQHILDCEGDSAIQKETQFMYIQMEFCEKSTLRTAIDSNLFEDMERTWRLFREVVEGLAHIHQQGMIHRDLKPVNIFLDSYDHVKIGDFGLATTNIILRNTPGEVLSNNLSGLNEKSDNPTSINDFALEESLTSNIGTALYVAPELVSKSFQGSKVIYSQKVDIYSLGIVFFEMIYHPIDTGMERVRVINGLRQKEIQFPSDFETLSMQRETILLKWLLNHDPRHRPTSLELLQSEYLPPPQMEEAELHEMFRHTLSNSQSKAYKYLISSCFHQNMSAAEELTYDMDTLKSQVESHANILSLVQHIKGNIKKICVQHGAVEVNTPMLLPKLSLYDTIPSQVRLMTHGGTVVALQHDLRVPFARYVVSNSLTHMKRFAIEKVFRERKVYGFHPREFYECAFDIITSAQGSLLAEAETLSVAFEIFQELPWMHEKNFTIRLGHTYLLDAVLIHFSIEETARSEIKAILTDLKDEKQAKSQVQTRLVSICLPDQFISILFTLMDIQGPLPKVSNILKSIVKRNGAAASRIKEGLHELQVLTELIEAFGLQCNVVISPTMIFGSNIYSGIIYQITCQMKKKRNRVTVDVVAVGGKYDELLKTLRLTREKAGITPTREIEQCGVGISISLDLLISGFQGEDMRERKGWNLVDVIVCSLGYHLRTKEKIAMLKKFWSHGISCTALDGSQNLETAEEQCIELGASFIVLLKEDSFNSNLRVRYLEKQRFLEKKVSTSEVVEFISSRLNYFSNNQQNSKVEIQRSVPPPPFESNAQTHQGSSGPCINVSFVITEGKDKPANWKRRQESMMIGHISEALRKLSKQQVVELLGIEVSSDVVKILSSELDISDKDQYNKTVTEILERHPRQRKIFKAICDEIYEIIFIKNSEIIVIYSLVDNFYKTLM